MDVYVLIALPISPLLLRVSLSLPVWWMAGLSSPLEEEDNDQTWAKLPLSFNYISMSSKEKRKGGVGGEEPLSNYPRLNYIKLKKNADVPTLKLLFFCVWERKSFIVSVYTWKTSVWYRCLPFKCQPRRHTAPSSLWHWEQASAPRLYPGT